jgi:hypothetical protein
LKAFITHITSHSFLASPIFYSCIFIFIYKLVCTTVCQSKMSSRPYNFIVLYYRFFFKFMVLYSAWWWLYIAETCSRFICR